MNVSKQIVFLICLTSSPCGKFSFIKRADAAINSHDRHRVLIVEVKNKVETGGCGLYMELLGILYVFCNWSWFLCTSVFVRNHWCTLDYVRRSVHQDNSFRQIITLFVAHFAAKWCVFHGATFEDLQSSQDCMLWSTQLLPSDSRKCSLSMLSKILWQKWNWNWTSIQGWVSESSACYQVLHGSACDCQICRGLWWGCTSRMCQNVALHPSCSLVR